MRVLDPGHLYEVDVYDGPDSGAVLMHHRRFLKRVGESYPGNEPPAHAGTNCQEELRVLIDRVRYLNGQRPDPRNHVILNDLRNALWNFELRAAERRNEIRPFIERVKMWSGGDLEGGAGWDRNHDRPLCIELLPTCKTCGHVLCVEHPSLSQL